MKMKGRSYKCGEAACPVCGSGVRPDRFHQTHRQTFFPERGASAWANLRQKPYTVSTGDRGVPSVEPIEQGPIPPVPSSTRCRGRPYVAAQDVFCGLLSLVSIGAGTWCSDGKPWRGSPSRSTITNTYRNDGRVRSSRGARAPGCQRSRPAESTLYVVRVGSIRGSGRNCAPRGF